MSIKNFILQFFISTYVLLLLAGQANSITCYECANAGVHECMSKDCHDGLRPNDALGGLFFDNLYDLLGSENTAVLPEMICGTVVIGNLTSKEVIRTCLLKDGKCRVYEEIARLAKANLTVGCHSCDTDLCNSSGRFDAGIGVFGVIVLAFVRIAFC